MKRHGWCLAAAFIALLIIVPLAVVLASVFSPERAIWQHLLEHVLPGLLGNTFRLVVGVAIGVTLLGVSLAWLTAVCEFPGRRFFSWALLLPLAMPAYVTAFVYVALLDFTGPLQTGLRELAGGPVAFPPIRSAGGVIMVMSLALYPYVYLLARNAFLTQGRRALEAAQSLGYSRKAGFFKVALPLARPWIMAGLMLALMETLADFGTVAVFNYDTFTTAIYKTWFGLFSLQGASQLASVLILLVFALIAAEQFSRRGLRFTQAGRHTRMERIVLSGSHAWLASGFAAVVLLVAFAIPVVQLLVWAEKVVAQDFDARYLGFLWHSLLLGGLAAALIVVAALVLIYAQRQHDDTWTRAMARIATLGYAVPGPVLAVGIVIPLAWLDQQLIGAARNWFGIDTGLILQGTLLVMLPAYLTRFLAVGYNPIDSAMQRVTRNLDEAAHSLGVSGLAMLRRVHLPMLRGGLLSAAALVFVDVMKEMPITLMTRPFGWDTLAVRIFEMTSEGEWERAALPSVALVLAGLLPVALLMKHTEKS
ncbi:MAG: iron ABC transporter permease [Gammaproteobacteria bacterium]|nr:iron ABC transporter permease [Gammaproteobacteria bacterium]MBU1731338.1 iron ABC transporter permease [Gammaproteobacteria bacterium]MBU1892843.1 iron ABC transporter permease [Gammaproteobacteria bacterium]